jgi:tRNA A-37 threonylcarbamoyl transferase component Bud32
VSGELQIGRILAGKYRLDHLLGKGGMGTVVAATHLGLGRKVALKFMRPGLVDDGESLGRFTREARAAAALRGEHVVQVMDVEVDADNGAPYIVMEHLEGSDLASVVQVRGALPPVEAVNYLLQACEGLAEAHANGIIHRDLKPANLFLTRRPDGTPLVKVLDFGVSKLSEAAQSGSFHITEPRKALGSPQYMSPEQMIASADVDRRTDIWALGVILYELLAGKRPFVAGSFLELSLEVTNRAPPSLARQVPGLAPGLVAIVERCLQKTPGGRFADVAALADALGPHAGPAAGAAVERITRTLGHPERTLELTRALPALPARPRRRVVGLVTATAIAAGLAAAAVLVFPRTGTPPRAEPAQSVSLDRPGTSAVAAAPVPAAQPASIAAAVAAADPTAADAGAARPKHRPAATTNADRVAHRPERPVARAAKPPDQTRPDEATATVTKRGPVIIGL